MKLKFFAILTAGLALLAAPCFAGGGHGKHFDRMAEYLQLTDEQKSQMQPLFEQMRQKAEAEREAFKNHLNPDQLAKLEQMKAERKERWAARKAARQSGEKTGEKRVRKHQGKRGHKFMEELNLNEGQQAAFEQMRANIKAERKVFRENFEALLTPDQVQKLKERKRHRKGKGKRHRGQPENG